MAVNLEDVLAQPPQEEPGDLYVVETIGTVNSDGLSMFLDFKRASRRFQYRTLKLRFDEPVKSAWRIRLLKYPGVSVNKPEVLDEANARDEYRS
jgi:hypothetical protein